MTKVVSPEEALIYVMVSMSAADRTMTDSELLKIGEEVQTLPVFQDFEEARLVPVSRDCSELLADGGVDAVLKLHRVVDFVHLQTFFGFEKVHSHNTSAYGFCRSERDFCDFGSDWAAGCFGATSRVGDPVL